MSALDVTGIVGFAAAMSSLLFFLSSLPDANWTLLAVTVVLWAALVVWERRARTPFFDVRLLASNGSLTRTYVRFAIVNLCCYIVLYGITQWIETAKGLGGLGAGLLLLPMTLVSGVVIILVSRRNLIRGPLLLCAVACIGAGLGVLALGTAVLGPDAWLPITLVITVVLGIALGTGASSNQTALYTQAPDEQLGTASGLLRSFGYLGSIASSAIIGVVFLDSVTDAGVDTIGWVMVGVSAVLLVVTLFDRTLRRVAG